jgi:hypothetical protein
MEEWIKGLSLSSEVEERALQGRADPSEHEPVAGTQK